MLTKNSKLYFSLKKNNFLFIFTCILFILNTFIHFYLSDFPKVFHVFQDELRYLSIAETLANGRGIMIYNQNTDFQKILYSVILIPAFFFSEKVLQIKAICFINSLVMSSGIFPVYLLSKRLLSDWKSILLVLFMFVVSSEFCYTLVFMSEVLYMPLGLWGIYLFFKIISLSDKPNPKFWGFYGITAGFVIYLLYLNKEIALSFLIAHFLFLVYQFIFYKIKKNPPLHELKRHFNVFLITCGTFFVLFAFFKSTIFNGYGNSYNQTSLDAISSFHNIMFMMYGFFYYLLCVFIAWFYFPLVFPLTSLKRLDNTKRNFIIFLTLLLLVSAGVIAYTITVREDLDKIVPRIHLRYICYLFIPFFIIFLSTLKETTNKTLLKPQFAVALILSANILIFFKGAADSSFVDNSALKYVPYYLYNDLRLNTFKLLLVLCILLATILFHIKRPPIVRLSIAAFMFISVSTNIINYKIAYDNYSTDYAISYTEQKELNDLRQFVLDHPESNFLVVHSGFRKRYQAMLDTYLNCTNVYTTDIPWLVSQQDDLGYDLNKQPIKPVYENGYYPVTLTIDYVVSTTSDIQWDSLSQIAVPFTEEKSIYALYKINSSGRLPLCSGVVPHRPGISHTITESPYFSTFYKKNGHPTFMSDENSGFLLYGPYAYITSGTYSITFEYDYNGPLPFGTEIGYADISAAEMDLTQYKVPLVAGQNTVTINNIIIPTASFSFESRIFTFSKGVIFKSVTYNKISN